MTLFWTTLVARWSSARVFLSTRWLRRSNEASIHESYDTVALVEVYEVLAYYLRRRVEVEAYIADQEQDAAEMEACIETEYTADVDAPSFWLG